MFNTEIGGQIAWLIPTALIFLVGLLWSRGGCRAPTAARAALLLWGGWLVVTGARLQLHARASSTRTTRWLWRPAIGALVGIGAVSLWSGARTCSPPAAVSPRCIVRRRDLAYRAAATARPTWHPWLRFVVLIGRPGASPAASLVDAAHPAAVARRGRRRWRSSSALAGPFAYSRGRRRRPRTRGAIPSAGPAVSGSGFGGARRPAAAAGGFGGGDLGAAARRQLSSGTGGTGGPGGFRRAPTGGAGGGAGGVGGLLDAATPSAALWSTLLDERARTTPGSRRPSARTTRPGYQLATGKAVMAIGGFNGTDPSPTLAQFEKWVSEGKIHYFIGGGSLAASAASAAVERPSGPQPDRVLGRVALHRDDHRRPDGLRPDGHHQLHRRHRARPTTNRPSHLRGAIAT